MIRQIPFLGIVEIGLKISLLKVSEVCCIWLESESCVVWIPVNVCFCCFFYCWLFIFFARFICHCIHWASMLLKLSLLQRCLQMNIEQDIFINGVVNSFVNLGKPYLCHYLKLKWVAFCSCSYIIVVLDSVVNCTKCIISSYIENGLHN